MFPLNTVLFPGMCVPLHIFEERYVAMVRHLLSRPEDQRHFVSVAIREGYEVGDHGQHELHRVGCRLIARDVAANPDGTFDLVAHVTDRVKMSHVVRGSDFAYAQITPHPDRDEPIPRIIIRETTTLFESYRKRLHDFRGDPLPGLLPTDPTELAWTLAAAIPMTMQEGQSVLEVPDCERRLATLAHHLQEELRILRVFPSLPASHVARTGWHPN